MATTMNSNTAPTIIGNGTLPLMFFGLKYRMLLTIKNATTVVKKPTNTETSILSIGGKLSTQIQTKVDIVPAAPGLARP